MSLHVRTFHGHGLFPSLAVYIVPETRTILWSVLPVFHAAFGKGNRTCDKMLMACVGGWVGFKFA